MINIYYMFIYYMQKRKVQSPKSVINLKSSQKYSLMTKFKLVIKNIINVYTLK